MKSVGFDADAPGRYPNMKDPAIQLELREAERLQLVSTKRSRTFDVVEVKLARRSGWLAGWLTSTVLLKSLGLMSFYSPSWTMLNAFLLRLH